MPTRVVRSLTALLAGLAACAGAPDEEPGALEAELRGARSYIVVLRDDLDPGVTLADLARRHGLVVTQHYRHALRGGAVLAPSESARAALEADPRVFQVDEDFPVQASAKPGASTPPPQRPPTGWTLVGAGETSNEGASTRVAVLDTGADLQHPDLRANLDLSLAKDCVNEGRTPYLDLNGHGTHVSGTIAAVDDGIGILGVGTAIRVVPVKVLDRRGSGTWSGIICGIDHVTAHAGEIAVANLSLGGAGTECSSGGCQKSALQLAIERSVAAGVTYVVAAGNESADASLSVPAAYSVVITVSAYGDTDGVLSSTDGWADFTNDGPGVDIAAPGYAIRSTYKGGTWATLSGTSMASPHVAAAAALFLSTHPGSSPQVVRDRLRAVGTATFPGSSDPRHGEPLLDVRALVPCALSCVGSGFECGSVDDACGGLAECGSCGDGLTCGAAAPNTCG